jgi:hypothetical protein
VNTETKTAIFGYGGIKLNSFSNYLEIHEIDYPLCAGTKLIDVDGKKIDIWEYTGKSLFIHFTKYEDAKQFYTILKDVEKNKGGIITVDDITLNFNNYRKVSMDIIKGEMLFILKNLSGAHAC